MNTSDPNAFFTELMGAYRRTKLVLVAHRLGVFDALAAKSADANAVADRVHAHPATLAPVLDALSGMGVLEKSGALYTNGAIAAEHLVKGRPMYLGHVLEMHDRLWEGWSNLEHVVRSGQPWRTLPALLEAEPDFADRYIRGMHNFSGPAAREVARLVGPGSVKRMLDVGGGPGTYAFAILEQNPEARATVLDLDVTLRITREFANAHPLKDRLELRVGNYLEDEYGDGFDLALMSHTTHDEPEVRVRDMLARAYQALDRGGRVAIHDWVLDDSGATPLDPALFGVHVMLYTDGGRVHRRADYERWLGEAGFVRLEHHLVLPERVASATTLLLGTKP